MKAEGPSRKMKMWNNIERKCIIHCDDSFDSSTTEDEVIGELLNTPTLSGKQKSHYVGLVSKSVNREELRKIAKKAAEEATRNDK